MCGLIAWWPARPDPDDRGYFRAGLDALIPRGPDEQGDWEAADGTAYLGHRRLRVTGDYGQQPLWSKDGQVAILVNGEFYDAGTLRETLQSKGYSFQTDSDSELLLPLYQEHGFDALKFLEGEFAFVLWDRGKDLVWAARDRAGVKPLRFAVGPRGLIIASEAKALFAAGLKPRWNQTSLAQALSVQYVHPQHTLFEGIQQLAPGEFRVFTKQHGRWQSHATQWWAWFATQQPLRQLDPQQAADGLQRALTHAVARRVDTPWPIATHLSGGLDSSAIALLASRLRPGQVHAYSVGFEPVDAGAQVQHDECRVAQATAAALGISWTRVDAGRMQLIEHWGDAVERSEALGINGHLVAKWLLARQVHTDGFRVSLSGEGADEALLGYAFLAGEGQDNLAALHQANPVARGVMLPDGEELDLAPIAGHWSNVPVWLHAKASLGARVATLLRGSWVRDHQARALELWARDTAPTGQNDVHRSASGWAKMALGGYILPSLTDAPEAGFGIQGRVPFLDGDVLEETMSWDPTNTGWPQTSKAPLRRWLAQEGLHEVAQRPKHPFEAPPLWGNAQVRFTLRQRWQDPGVWGNTPVDPARVLDLMDTLDAGDAPLWQLWEPVVALLLSVDHLQQRFQMEASGV